MYVYPVTLEADQHVDCIRTGDRPDPVSGVETEIAISSSMRDRDKEAIDNLLSNTGSAEQQAPEYLVIHEPIPTIAPVRFAGSIWMFQCRHFDVRIDRYKIERGRLLQLLPNWGRKYMIGVVVEQGRRRL
jgi:hypothetical protein